MGKIIDQIREYLQQSAHIDEKISVKDTDSLTKLGIIDSIGLLQLVDFIEKTYSIEVSPDLIIPENFDTLQGIEKLIVGLTK